MTYPSPPSPYQPPPGPPMDYYQQQQQTPGEVSAAARRAGILLWVLGALMTMLGTCNVLSASSDRVQEMYDKQMSMLPADQRPPFGPEAFKTLVISLAVGMGLLGLALILFGT